MRFAYKPPRWLKAGDRLGVEIDGIGGWPILLSTRSECGLLRPIWHTACGEPGGASVGQLIAVGYADQRSSLKLLFPDYILVKTNDPNSTVRRELSR